MRISAAFKPLPGERAVGVFPPLVPFGERRWTRRLHFYTGRALTDLALQTEQEGRAGRLATAGQMLSPGVIQGLETGLEREEITSLPPVMWLHIAPGQALTARGEDVSLPQALRLKLNELPLVPTPALLARLNRNSLPLKDNSFGALRAQLPQPLAAVLVLHPATAESSGTFDPKDPCEINPRDEAFNDKQTVDGCIPMLYLWPEEWRPLPLPETLPVTLSVALSVALSVERWRNRLAFTIFNAELALGPDEFLPWEESGVPIALLGFSNAADAQPFIDRYSVVRAGGRPPRTTPLVGNSGNPFLWQARIQQFAEHVNELATRTTPPDQLGQFFATLPPFGLLPRGAVPLLRQSIGRPRTPPLASFFPPSFGVTATPIPVEELDALVPGTASLMPFDMGAAGRTDGVTEHVQLLVPVPLTVYDPDLLVFETIDPEFTTEMTRLTGVRDQWRQRRDLIREKTRVLHLAQAGDELTIPTESVDADEKPATGALDPLELGYGLTGAGTDSIVTELRAFKETYAGANAAAFTKHEIEQFGLSTLDQPLLSNRTFKGGLEDFIDLLTRKVKYAEDRIDVSFTRAQTDMYRIRQLVLGVDAATKLATSPALAAIAQGQTATATRENIESYISRSKTQINFNPPTAVGVLANAAADIPPAALLGVTGRAADLRDVSSAGDTADDSAARTAVAIGRFGGGIGLNIPVVNPFPLVRPGVIKTSPVFVVDKAPLVLDRGGIPPPTVPKPDDISEQASIVGKPLDFRTVTISDRITQPVGPEAKDYSVSNKHDVIDSLLNPTDPALALYLDDIVIPGFHGYAVNGDLVHKPTDFFVFDEANPKKPASARRTRQVPSEAQFSFKDIREKGVLRDILQGKHDLDPADGDEGAFFSGSVRAIDHTVATLRLIEGRVKSYKTFIKAGEALLATLRQSLGEANARLQTIGNELAEARHDVTVARALLAEETTRLNQINQRRDDILREHVSFLAFCRQRHVTNTISAPSRPLDPGLRAAPVPACLNHAVRIPPELRRMVDFLREAPVRWLPYVHPLLDQLDDLHSLVTTMQSAQVRAEVQAPLRQAGFGVTPGFYTAAFNQVFAAQAQTMANARALATQAAANLDTTASWRAVRDRAADFLSVADLIEGAHGRSNLARLTTYELDQIAQIAGCLYESFGRVPARVRLLWAEQLSQFDASVNLRNLSSLTRWGLRWHDERTPQLIEELDQQERFARRDMQALVDFLYQRIDPRMTEAVGLINDLIRIAILLASHAPVNEIITGRVPRRTPVIKNTMVAIAADVTKVKIGMEVVWFDLQDQAVARGIVEDLDATQVAARIVHTERENFTLEPNARALFTARVPRA